MGIKYQFNDGSAAIKLDRQLWDYLPLLERPDQLAVMEAAIAEPLRWFCPNGKQEEFIGMVANSVRISKIPVILFTAANGIGKTTTSLHIVANVIYGAQNGWFDYPMFINYPFPKLAWYITTRSAIENVLIKQMSELFPPGTYTFDKRGKPYVSAVHFTNGWELVFFTQDQDTKEMESATVGLIVGDEPFTEDIWKAAKSRRRMGCVTLLPMTPLDVEPFIVDEVTKNAEQGVGGYFRLTASVYDACKRRGVRGHLDPDIIDQMVANYSDEERQARAFGDFMYFSERIYPTLTSDRHWVDPSDYPLELSGGKTYHVVDPHDGRPCAVIWGQIQAVRHSAEYKQLIADKKAKQQYRYVIFFESPLETRLPFWEMKDASALGEQVEKWIEIEQDVVNEQQGVKVNTRVLDHVFGWQTRNSSTIANTLSNEGRKRGYSMVFKPSSKSKNESGEIAYGHNAVRELLQDLEDGKPGLVIWRNCWHTWNGLTHYIRKRPKNSDVERAVGETKIIEKYKDFPDVVRFFCCEKAFGVGQDAEKPEPSNAKRKTKRKPTGSTRSPIEAILRQI